MLALSLQPSSRRTRLRSPRPSQPRRNVGELSDINCLSCADDFDVTLIPAQQSGSGIHSVRTGRRGAPLVVLIHAVGVDLTYWGDQIEMLQASFDVVAYDLPGHGGSAKPTKGFGFAEAVETLTGVIAGADSGPAHLIGLSV